MSFIRGRQKSASHLIKKKKKKGFLTKRGAVGLFVRRLVKMD